MCLIASSEQDITIDGYIRISSIEVETRIQLKFQVSIFDWLLFHPHPHNVFRKTESMKRCQIVCFSHLRSFFNILIGKKGQKKI